MTLDERERSGSSAKLAREKREREGEREGGRWKEREREREGRHHSLKYQDTWRETETVFIT